MGLFHSDTNIWTPNLAATRFRETEYVCRLSIIPVLLKPICSGRTTSLPLPVLLVSFSFIIRFKIHNRFFFIHIHTLKVQTGVCGCAADSGGTTGFILSDKRSGHWHALCLCGKYYNWRTIEGLQLVMVDVVSHYKNIGVYILWKFNVKTCPQCHGSGVLVKACGILFLLCAILCISVPLS